MSEEIRMYKIKRADGKFSAGGMYPTFTRGGKIWKRRGDLTAHLNQVRKNGVYADCEIVEIVMIEQHVGTISLQEWMSEVQDKKAKAEQKRREEYEARQRAFRRQQFLELQKEFGDESA